MDVKTLLAAMNDAHLRELCNDLSARYSAARPFGNAAEIGEAWVAVCAEITRREDARLTYEEAMERLAA